MDIHGGTPYPLALAMRMSYAKAYIDSNMHTQHVKAVEWRQGLYMAALGRLDGIIKAVVGLSRMLGRRR